MFFMEINCDNKSLRSITDNGVKGSITDNGVNY